MFRALINWASKNIDSEVQAKLEKKAEEAGVPVVEVVKPERGKKYNRRERKWTDRHPEALVGEEPELLRGRSLKLDDEKDQREFCKLVGEYNSTRDIERWALGRGKQINVQQLIYYYKNSEKWKPLIEKYRAEYRQNISEVPVANKVKRLWELNAAYDRIRVLEDFTEDPLLKLSCLNMEVKLVNQAQQETEGKGAGGEQTNVYFTQFNNMSREEFDKWRLNLAEKIQRYQAKAEVTDGVQSQEGNGAAAGVSGQ